MTGKKWMIVVTDEQYEWIKKTAERTGLKGSDVVREMVERQMSDNPKEFVASLAATQYKIELSELEAKRQEIEEKQLELKKKLKEGVAV